MRHCAVVDGRRSLGATKGAIWGNGCAGAAPMRDVTGAVIAAV